MEKKNCLSIASRINDRLCDVYRDAFREITETAKELGIVKIRFGLDTHKGVDVPELVFEQEYENSLGMVVSSYEADTLSEMVFNENYDTITLIGECGRSAYMDSHWGDYFDVAKIGHIYQAFMTVVGNDDLKPIELK